MSSFPATFGAPGHGDHVESLRLREVLGVDQIRRDLRGVLLADGRQIRQSSLIWRDSAIFKCGDLQVF
jgi:hypothetical protein